MILKTFLFLILSVPYAFSSEVKEEALSFFKKSTAEANKIHFYRDKEKSSLAVKSYWKSSYKLSENSSVFSFRIRFLIPRTKLRNSLFKRAEDFSMLNRKTIFQQAPEGVYKAERPSLFVDIDFTMKAKVSSSDSPSEKVVQEFAKQSSVSGKPDLVVMQKMTDYNHFIHSSEFNFGLYPFEDKYYLVEVYGYTRFFDSTPGLAGSRAFDGFPDKVEHFEGALQKVLSTQD